LRRASRFEDEPGTARQFSLPTAPEIHQLLVNPYS
jgi:hypothetical protein